MPASRSGLTTGAAIWLGGWLRSPPTQGLSVVRRAIDRMAPYSHSGETVGVKTGEDALKFVTYDNRCSGCRACLLACSIANFNEITTAKAALIIKGRFPTPGIYHVQMCDDCGNCADACPEDAIVWDENRFVLREEECTACGICSTACPLEVLRSNADNDQPILCTGCGECAAICPRDAIEMASKSKKKVDA
jgi:Fe-S-cluster-containing hydrogenase component 2